MDDDDQPLRDRAVALIASAGFRTPDESDQLAAALHDWCWPGGSEDRTEAGAREWLGRSGTRPFTAIDLPCTCADGRCDLCN